jgi:ketopantoate reductase
MLIVGTGAMACLFAARLSASGSDVIMLGTWREGIEPCGRGGVTLVDVEGASNLPVCATDDPAGAPGALGSGAGQILADRTCRAAVGGSFGSGA